MAKALATIRYANIGPGETVTIALMATALNDLEVKLGNILKAYVQASHRKSVDYFES